MSIFNMMTFTKTQINTLMNYFTEDVICIMST